MTDAKPGKRSKQTSEPITVRPPFDPGEFARDSEAVLQAGDPSTIPTVVPPRRTDLEPELLVASVDWEPEALVADWVPSLAVGRAKLEWHDLEPDARALLVRVDGRATVAEIAEASGVAIREAIGELEELARRNVIRWR